MRNKSVVLKIVLPFVLAAAWLLFCYYYPSSVYQGINNVLGVILPSTEKPDLTVDIASSSVLSTIDGEVYTVTMTIRNIPAVEPVKPDLVVDKAMQSLLSATAEVYHLRTTTGNLIPNTEIPRVSSD